MLVGPTGARKLIGTRHTSIPGRDQDPIGSSASVSTQPRESARNRPGVLVLRAALGQAAGVDSALPAAPSQRRTLTTGVIRAVNEQNRHYSAVRRCLEARKTPSGGAGWRAHRRTEREAGRQHRPSSRPPNYPLCRRSRGSSSGRASDAAIAGCGAAWFRSSAAATRYRRSRHSRAIHRCSGAVRGPRSGRRLGGMDTSTVGGPSRSTVVTRATGSSWTRR